jgi:hypothetical protein
LWQAPRRLLSRLLQQRPTMVWIVHSSLRYIDHCIAPAV